ncbi:MAG: hypothetical protein A2Y07_03155 [Planctomycetes bacterium GWF2_50_10]|nr:MAG: hypothetical protein A2Y07_03155 [Planctomycetes bacterium GWF2_50_10]
MRTPASIAGHPFHPMLIVFPLGLLTFSLVCQVINLASPAQQWTTAAIYTMGGGIIGGLLAAMPGFIDLISIPPSKARKKGIWHMTLNLTVVLLFIIAFYIAVRDDQISRPVFALSLTAVILAIISGWLGGDLVYIHGIAVKDNARP